MKNSLRLALIVALAALSAANGRAQSAVATPLPPNATAHEVELGDKAAAEIAKDPKTKWLDPTIPANKALEARLNVMVTELGKASSRPLIKYQVRVIEKDDVNAFTLPNGHVYVYRGLINKVGSDDELAAVLAHEIGHNALMHALRAERKEKPLGWISMVAMLAALTGKSGMDIAQMTPYILTGVMSGYSVGYEQEADKAAIHELTKTQYNPSALVTFMNRMSDDEFRNPEVRLGIFQTHPASAQRVSAAINEIRLMGLPFTPRDVMNGPTATVVASATGGIMVKWNGTTLFELTDTATVSPDAKTRAGWAASRINTLMRANLHLFEIHVEGDANAATISARHNEIVRVTQAEAGLQHTTPLALAQKWKQNFSRLFWSETVKGNI